MSSAIASDSQHDLQAERNALAEYRHDADDERDVGRHRHAPPAKRRFADSARLAGSCKSPRARASRRAAAATGNAALRVAQFARDQFALDFQPDDEEENRHQHIVDDEVTEFAAELERRPISR